ncbi:MAG: phosphate ABC transporter permease PstA [Devosia sp.]|uniref:phosphate ABC transporter permease PstA n=1 Tax=Devosia sp. TaxID=1871048 RepID=UPI001AC9106B|nr:phosphate ABC transporter permease PstA [Devosia sp.]MBN9317877.1 phosphate ABC transporter permease PstA [Devosia sp.]
MAAQNIADVKGRTEELASVVSAARRKDYIFAIIGVLVLIISMGMLVALLYDLFVDGIPRLSWDFLTSFPSRRPANAGILSAWVGTSLVMLVTACLAIPVGVMAGLYLEEYAPKNWLTDIIEINVSNLAGVPSIIYGLLALGLFVYILGLGRTVLVAGMVLALLILPVVIVATREAVRSIPVALKEGAYGIGADKWQTMWHYIIPAARPGILTGAIVGLSRAIGETAPVITIGALTFIAFLPPAPVQGTPPFVNFDWLSAPFTVMPIQMFNWISRPQEAFHVNAAATGVILLAMSLMMNAIAIWIRYRLRRAHKS